MALSDLITVDASGFHYPDYAAILSQLKTEYQAIYGADVYLEADSQDGQWLAVMALALFDTIQVAAATYNSFSPLTAQRDALSRNVKINGIARLVATFSQCDVTVTGAAGTVITNGAADDTIGQRWLLPASVVIPGIGSIIVTATAQNVGAVGAAPGTITSIATPTLGWQGITNVSAATVGAPVESDAALRRRQALSTALPSRSILDGMVGAVASLIGVSRAKAYENDSNATDGDGLPAHSIALIVEGGDAQAIGEAMARTKTPGTTTYGTTPITTLDAYGITNIINFFRPTNATIAVEVTITALPGYASSYADAIKAAVSATVLALGIGEDLYVTRLYGPATLGGQPEGAAFFVSLIRVKKNAGAFGTSNIVLDFNEAAICSAVADVTVIVV